MAVNKYNQEGYEDPTAYDALRNIDSEKIRVDKLLRVIFMLCDLVGYDVKERIILVNKKTGREWR